MSPSRSSDVKNQLELSASPALMESSSGFEYILVVQDEEASQLTDELRLIFDHLDDDIKTEKEFEELADGFLRLARVVSESRPSSFKSHKEIGQKISQKLSNVRLHCCSICNKPFLNNDELVQHASDQLHAEIDVQRFHLYCCKLCETTPFREPENLVDHFKLRHHTTIDDSVIGDKADKVAVVQMYCPNPGVLRQRIEVLGNGVLVPRDAFAGSEAKNLTALPGRDNKKSTTPPASSNQPRHKPNPITAPQSSHFRQAHPSLQEQPGDAIHGRHRLPASASSLLSIARPLSTRANNGWMKISAPIQRSDAIVRTTPVKALDSNLKPRTMKFSDIRKHHVLTEIAVLRPRNVEERGPDDLADLTLPQFRLKGNPDIRDEFNTSSDEDKFVRNSDAAIKRSGTDHAGAEPAPKRPFASSDSSKKSTEGFVSFASMVSPNHSTSHFNLNLNRQNAFLKPRDANGRFVRATASKPKPKNTDTDVAAPVIKFEADFSDEKMESSENPILSFRKPFDRVENVSRVLV